MACFARALCVAPGAADQKCVACDRRKRTRLVWLTFHDDTASHKACVCPLCLEACRAIQLAPLELDQRGVLLPDDAHRSMLVAYLSPSGDAMPRDDSTLRQLAGLRSKSILALLTTLCPQLQQQKKRWSQLHVQTHGATAGSSRNGITGVQLQTRGLLPGGSLSAAAYMCAQQTPAAIAALNERLQSFQQQFGQAGAARPRPKQLRTGRKPGERPRLDALVVTLRTSSNHHICPILAAAVPGADDFEHVGGAETPEAAAGGVAGDEVDTQQDRQVAADGRAGHQARMDEMDYHEKWWIAQSRIMEARAGETLKLLKQKMEIAESVGMHDKAAALKRKLSDMLNA